MIKVRHLLPEFGYLPWNVKSDGVSGSVGVALNLACCQSRVGLEVNVQGLCDVKGPRLLGDVPVTGIQPWPLGKIGRYDFRYVASVWWTNRGLPRADILHAYSNPYLLGLSPARYRVLHYQVPLPQSAVRAYCHALQRADLILCCSTFVRQQLLSSALCSSDKAHVLPNGVASDFFKHKTEADREIRHRLGIPDDAVVILFAGQINQEKGLRYLLEAVRNLSEECNAHLLVVGSSRLWRTFQSNNRPDRSNYEIELREKFQCDRIHFAGIVPHSCMPAYYRASDIFVCPSTWPEPFGMVIVEAMAAGLPVVASRTGGIPEVVVDGDTGVLIPPGSVSSLIDVLRVLVQDPALRNQYGAQGRRRAIAYRWDSITDRLLRLYMDYLPGLTDDDTRSHRR